MTSREMLHAEVDNLHYFALTQLADEAEESGEADLAAGYRWLRDHGRWPALTLGGKHRWHSSLARGTHCPSNLSGSPCPKKHYARVSAALEAAARGLFRDGQCLVLHAARYERIRKQLEGRKDDG